MELAGEAVKKALIAKLQELTRLSRREGRANRGPALSAAQRGALIAEIQFALQRLETGAYGVCLGCDKQIGSRRLRAVPWASMCAACERRVEAERKRTGLGSADSSEIRSD